MDANSNETVLLMMIDDLEKRIKLLQKKNDEMKKMVEVLFSATQKLKEDGDGNL